ncbi:MAG: nucleoside hydrolase [Clostridiaceae bacterium]|nr:nucleoside hydrolase [Clostridiaceae bacterium]
MSLRKAPYVVPREKKVRVIIDTDCHCEADDQFAVAHQLMTPKLDVVGINATHYATRFGAKSVEESMLKSYDEALKVVSLMGLSDEYTVYKGCKEQLKDEISFVDSDASRFIVEESLRDDERPLFITVQGALTNVASAYLMNPKIADKFTIIWIGGGEYPKGGVEFNTDNDINAANVIMDSPIELWQVPVSVYRMMKVSFATLYDRVYPYGDIGKYLVEYMMEFNNTMIEFVASIGQWFPEDMSEPAKRAKYPAGESWQLGDNPVVGLLLTDHEGHFTVEGAPRFNTETCEYLLRPANPRKIRVYNYIDNHFILEDFFAKIKYYYG